ncbi:MAG: hypothetical protein NTV34_16545 [Proteobacteria bacterium]|nr:hypothetical protein [Pseudomonadota bacterium]
MRLFGFILLMMVPGGASAGSSNHGGDGIAITFLKAQPLAAEMVGGYKALYTTDEMSNDAFKSWFALNADELAADILASRLEFTEEVLEHEALTGLTQRATIRLSLPKLRLESQSKVQAAGLLIHESMHHLGVADELFAYFGSARIADHWERQNPSARGDPKVSRMILPTGAETSNHDEEGTKSARVLTLMAGDEAFVWNGIASPFMYSAAKNTWRPIATAGQPSSRSDSYIIWTGKDVIVWGGHDTVDRHGRNLGNNEKLDDGAAYNPKTNSWRPLSKTNAPKARFLHAGSFGTGNVANDAVWTGSEVVIPGGCILDRNRKCDFVETKLYNPAKDTWRTANNRGHPQVFHAKVFWTGETGNQTTSNQMILVGSTDNQSQFDGKIYFYSPSTDSWSSRILQPSLDYPAADVVSYPQAAWVKNKLVVFSTHIWSAYKNETMYMQVYDTARDANASSQSLSGNRFSPQNKDFDLSPTRNGLWIQCQQEKIAFTLDIDTLKWRIYELNALSSRFTGLPILWTGESILSFFDFSNLDDQTQRFGGHIIELPE